MSTNPTITEQAVEAAAEYLPHSSDCEVRPERDCTCWKLRVNLMREALEAAAPVIAAQALEDAARDVAVRGDIGRDGGISAWNYLNSRAELARTNPYKDRP